MVATLALVAGAVYVMVLVACVHTKIDLGSPVAAYLLCLLVFVVVAAASVAFGCSIGISALAGIIAITCLVPLAMLGNRHPRPNSVWYPLAD